ncbi:MAG: MarR family transcriptional regulator [Anaerolineae bacterium]|uniref:MarR family winged helix-turn-helix transcriptional regulator n=1 Tax=Promineifilum sp. TaxID=2664178 RepID=UPI001D7C81E9|nr:MarR family transcriptional regulator [Anaerolineales bacterium]MCB8933925.1 MarR family transcriptional regulator [Promineifilum sp.]MCO5181484.1 MarR family transcriptional regulator [Promineifilum sp.]MCW5846398.1 MarR family transcriptional regulator [Anaerolineae bacterium]
MAESVRLYDLVKESFLLLDFGDRLFLERFGLTVPRYYVLTHVANEPGLSPSVLSRYMFCDKSNITRLVRGLQSNGLVERRPHEQDGRTHRLFLTAAGAALYEQSSRAHRHYVEARLQSLEPDGAEQLTQILTHLNRALTAALDNTPERSPI